jgi:uncharacterized protein YndB with AHSA1/START domain
MAWEQSRSVLLSAPIELVWQVWTQPAHIQHWWGPVTVTNTIEKMDVHPAANG